MKEKQITTKSRTARQNRTFRLSDYESRKLSEGAKAARMNESKYVRELIIHGGVDATHAEDRRNLIRQVTMICSPGLLIDEMQIERLCRNSLVAFNISLDSVNSKINDYQRGREGACDSAKRLISYIDKYGLGKIFTSVEMVITKKNKKEIEPLVQEMINHNVNEIRIQPVVAMNYMTYDKGLALNFEDIDEIQKEIERVTKKYAINNAKEGMLCVRFVDQSKAVIKGMKDKINWGGIISPEGDLMLNGYIPYIYGNLFEYADFQDAWQKGFAKGWEIIQKDETLQNVKNIIDLQKLFKEKGFVKKRYE